MSGFAPGRRVVTWLLVIGTSKSAKVNAVLVAMRFEIAAARAATPGWRWTVRTPDAPSPDLWRELHEATVVVTHGGNNAVAELSAARVPAVVEPAGQVLKISEIEMSGAGA